MNFIRAVVSGYSKSFSFSGRASRSEYWPLTLWFLALYAPLFLFKEFDPFPISAVVVIALVFLSWPAYVSATVRRLHDTGRSGWWFFIQLVPFVGPFILLAFLFMKGNAGPNAHGNDPLETSGETSQSRG